MTDTSPACTCSSAPAAGQGAAARETVALAAFFKALGHPVRLRMVEMLLRGEKCVCELHADSGKEMSTISNHLSILRSAGVVTGEQRGKNIYYTLSCPCLASVIECLKAR